jgi:hypothetical protein
MPSWQIEIEWEHSTAAPQPVWFAPPAGLAAGDPLVLRPAGGDQALTPVQWTGDGRLVALVTPQAGAHRFALECASGSAAPAGGVASRVLEGDRLELRLGDELFGFYHFAPDLARPFIYPVLGPGGVAVTRHFPMRPDVAGESRDHPHHRSLWTAYGEVNDVDNWSEEKGHGSVRHLEFDSVTSGPVCGGFVARNRWVDPQERPQVEERRAVTLYHAGPERRLLDYEVTFTAGDADVQFGDTKEGGLLSFRVATPMDGEGGGRIENGGGGRGEKECWGRPSPWCDYSGTVEGAHLGIAVMDHPDNLRHPVYWHVRDYGLMTTNPFGTSTFENDPGKRGEYTLRAGDRLHFRYRVLIHRGDAREGRVAETWDAFARPAAVRVLAG